MAFILYDHINVDGKSIHFTECSAIWNVLSDLFSSLFVHHSPFICEDREASIFNYTLWWNSIQTSLLLVTQG